MKKSLIVSFSMLALLAVGCSKNEKPKLICSYDAEAVNEGSFSSKYEISYDKEGKNMQAVYYYATDTFDKEKYEKEEIDEYILDYKEDCALYKDYASITCEITHDDNKIMQEISIDITKATDEEIESILGVAKEDLQNYDDFKNSMIQYGYTCE